MGCREILEALGDYLDGALEEKVEGRVERHLRRCVRCRILCETTRKTIELYKGSKCYGVPLDVEFRLMTMLARRRGDGLDGFKASSR